VTRPTAFLTVALACALVACMPGRPGGDLATLTGRPVVDTAPGAPAEEGEPQPGPSGPGQAAAEGARNQPAGPPALPVASPGSEAQTSAGSGGGGSGGGGRRGSSGVVAALTPGTQAPNSWRQWPLMVRPRFGFAAGRVGDALMAVGGEPRGSGEVLPLTPTGPAAWAPLTGLEFPPTDLVAHAAAGQHLVVAGPTGTYRLSPGSVEDLGFFMAQPVVAGASALDEQRGRLLVFGGLNQGGVTPFSQHLTVASDTVPTSLRVTFPSSYAGAAAAVVGDEAWVVGGYAPVGAVEASGTAQVRTYDLTNDTWRDSADGAPGAPPALPSPRHSAAMVALAGQLYLVGGLGPDGTPDADVLRLDPAAPTPAWTVVTRLPTPRSLLVALAVNGVIVTLGGVDAAGRASAVVEGYRP